MITVKLPLNATPRRIRDKVYQTLVGVSFSQASNFGGMVANSVNMGARNTKNFASKDLAALQVCDLAEQYGVRVERS